MPRRCPEKAHVGETGNVCGGGSFCACPRSDATAPVSRDRSQQMPHGEPEVPSAHLRVRSLHRIGRHLLRLGRDPARRLRVLISCGRGEGDDPVAGSRGGDEAGGREAGCVRVVRNAQGDEVEERHGQRVSLERSRLLLALLQGQGQA